MSYLGNQIEADLEQIDGKTAKDIIAKRNSRLARILGEPEEKQFAPFTGFGK